MSLVSRIRALALAGLVLAAVSAPGASSAASMSHMYALHGSGQFGKAMASASVRQVSNGDFKVTIVAENLPSPTMLRVMPARHTYVAWLIDGMAKKNSMAATAHLALMFDKKTGNYTASGTLMISAVSSVFVTAEPSGMVHAPAMPEVTALSSMGHGSM